MPNCLELWATLSGQARKSSGAEVRSSGLGFGANSGPDFEAKDDLRRDSSLTTEPGDRRLLVSTSCFRKTAVETSGTALGNCVFRTAFCAKKVRI